MTRPRVLLLLHELTYSGAPKVALDIFDTFDDRFDVRIFTLADGPLADRCRRLGPVTNLKPLNSAHTPLHRVRRNYLKTGTEKALQRWKPDVIYINSIAALRMVNLLDFPAAPILLHVHELESVIRYFTRGSEAALRERPSRYIACSEAVRQTLTQDFGIEAAKIELVYECIPDSHARPELLLPSKEANGPFIVGGAGMPNMRKGVTLWLEMAAELVAKVGAESVKFVWVGVHEDADSALFQAIARKMGLEQNIEFVPVTPKPMEHFARFDVFAMTSWEDPCPIVVLEAMLLQKPVVCFAPGGGASEEIGDTGIAVEGFSPGGMAEAIAGLMRDGERRKTLGQRSRARVLAEFTASVQAPKIEGILHALIRR